MSKDNISSILQLNNYTSFKAALTNYNCQNCSLSPGRNHLVVDRGNPKSKVMIIGEAPGRDEDMQGKPFVGRSGRLMDQLFTEEGFDTNTQALVANIAKCRPPNNRPPTLTEAAACKPFLFTQIKLMKPKFILLMGRTAVKHVLPHLNKLPMNEIIQTNHQHPDFPQINFFVFFHPAYILRDPRKKPIMKSIIRLFLLQLNR